MTNGLAAWAGAVLLPAVLGGCTLAHTRSESVQIDAVSALMGRVVAPPQWDGPVIVVAATTARKRAVVAHQARLHEPGAYELLVPPGTYTLLAYGDRDGNGAPDGEDPAAVMGGIVSVDGAHMIMGLDLDLTWGLTDVVRSTLPAQRPEPPPLSTQIGAIADLDSEPFSADAGKRSYWTPMAGFRSNGGNVWFLEAYDPNRTPVLFVHGASGSAQDWRYFFENLDWQRYQAWFFQYPSGAPLDAMAHLLHWKLENLRLRYRIDRLHVVAHSMGGLVVQRFLEDHGAEFPEIGRFITISTPWDGEPRATLGVKHSPAVVPSWRDLQPEGSFVRSLFERPLPEQIDYALFFGHRGGPSLMRPTSDGTVTLASQLRPEAQRRARVVLGFDEDHTSILSSPRVLTEVMRQLAAP